MLSRTADHLFWMARYIERAENTARMLDANYQLSLLPQSDEFAKSGWRAMLSISELSGAYAAEHANLTSRDVIAFMARDKNNLSSIVSCLRAARENARAVRGSITTELWESLNTTWLECQKLLADGILERDPAEFFEWVKFRSHLARGVQTGTMVRDESYYFMRLGTVIERADNTARILDVKFEMREQTGTPGGTQSLDYYHWTALLRSVSGFEVYRKVYRDVITPERVAGLLILFTDWPRSLAASLDEVREILGRVRNARSAQTERMAEQLFGDVRRGRIGEILSSGLHAYLTEFLARVNDLACCISRDFLVPLVPTEPESIAA
ncbi:alpha-E domain-containing protein [Trinickia violacea]|uniref:Alpha-E domain-containing protein n=1 Tax=Trinickia violacea TaxID=2571746 RepID=A0A4V1EIC2_9BURK|nr:alpha-E domain-containing protein [Trinickia violacea]QCP53260.1 alpha-E domain-containing protein [Trinickia violacea]